MALVAYDNSDSSDLEEDNENATNVSLIKKIEEPSVSNSITENVAEEADNENLFNLLPQPTIKKSAIVEEDDEFLHKKETVKNVKPKARITVPSLSDFRDVEDSIPNTKPKITNGKKSGLLSMLPQPKNTTVRSTSLIPHVLTQKPNNIAKKKEPLPTPIKKPKVETSKTLAISYSDDSDNDDDVQNDFFSINKQTDIQTEDIPLITDQTPLVEGTVDVNQPNRQKEPRSIESYFKQNTEETHMELQSYNVDASGIQERYGSSSATGTSQNGSEQSSTSGDLALDDEAILKLCGSRGKRKREEIQIVDVNQQEVLADAREWLLKGLMDDTSKRVSSSKRRGDEPTSQQRRKHQITYLAHQAKANEIELQNQWANNRMSKRQTQSKYGF